MRRPQECFCDYVKFTVVNQKVIVGVSVMTGNDHYHSLSGLDEARLTGKQGRGPLQVDGDGFPAPFSSISLRKF